jgi:hypothetical protein
VERFEVNRLTVTFLLLIAAVAMVVAVAAPFGSIVLGALSLLAVGVVLIKAMFRARRWWPLTAVEGTIAVSGLALLGGGIGVIGYSMVTMGTEDGPRLMIGWPSVSTEVRSRPRTSSVMYTDADLQQQVKDGLRAAGVPYTLATREGSEYISWPADHDAAVQAVIEKIVGRTLPNNRNVHFTDAAVQKQFIEWLDKKGIKYEMEKSRGVDHVVWEEGKGEVLKDFFASRGTDCKGRVAAGKPESRPC